MPSMTAAYVASGRRQGMECLVDVLIIGDHVNAWDTTAIHPTLPHMRLGALRINQGVANVCGIFSGSVCGK